MLHGSGDPQPNSTNPTLGDLAAERDAERFVGRTDLLSSVSAALEDHEAMGGARVMYLHGPGGVGKSAALRALARHAAAGGITVLSRDARQLDTGRFPSEVAVGADESARSDVGGVCDVHAGSQDRSEAVSQET